MGFTTYTQTLQVYSVKTKLNTPLSFWTHDMARTLLQVQKQIAELKEVEERLKIQEADGVAARIKEAIAAYGFTPEQLFGPGLAGLVPKQNTTKLSKSAAKHSQPAQYADDAGNQWVGRGPRPAWLRQALQSGRSLSDFAISRAAKKRAKTIAAQALEVAQSHEQTPAKNVGGAGKKRAVKFRDDQGNTWSGGGSQPRWLKAALAHGKALEDFRP